jgi:hypothetical protein
MTDNPCVIGLFGTCGKSTWRKDFIKVYEERGFGYYNPQVKKWTPGCAKIEAWHLANDRIVLLPVTHESYGVGSLAETGYSIIQALRLDDRRNIIILVDQYLDDELMGESDRAKESLSARALIIEHLKRINIPNCYLVETMDEMLMLSIQLYLAQLELEKVKNWSLKERFHAQR